MNMSVVEKLDRDSGAILIISLWMLVILSLLALSLGHKTSLELQITQFNLDKLKSFAIIKAGINKAKAVILSDEQPDYDSLNEPWSNGIDPETLEYLFKDIAVGQGSFTVSYKTGLGNPDIFYGLMDEEGKININTADFNILKAFFKLQGLEEYMSEGLAAAIIDWRDADSESFKGIGAESDYYQSLNPPYPCKNASFENLEELLLVKDMSEDLFTAIKGLVTIYPMDGDGRVNINTAGPIILSAFCLASAVNDQQQDVVEDLVNYISIFRRGPDGILGSEDDGIFTSISGIAEVLDDAFGLDGPARNLANNLERAVKITSNTFRLKIKVLSGNNAVYEAEAVLERDEDIKVIFWREA